MKWLYNMKISSKLIASFVVVALLAGVVGTIGLVNMRNIDREYTKLYVNYGISTGDIGDAGINFNSTRAAIRDVLISKDPEAIEKYVKKLEGLDTEIQSSLDKFEKSISTQEVRDIFSELKKNMESYSTLRGKVIQMVQAGKRDEATDLFYSEGAPILTLIEEGIDKLFDEKRAGGEELSNQLSTQTDSTVTTMIVTVVIAVVVALVLGVFISRMISNPVRKLVSSAEKIADGDLDVHIDNEYRDEVGILAAAFRKMTDNLNDVMTNIQTASEQVAAGSKQVSEVSISLSQGATEQASSIEQLSASMEEIASQTKQNAENATLASQLAEMTRTNAILGSEQMNEMLKAMDGINTSSESISKIIKVIDEIAFQTNILALNAAVEAARAGQHGKGFAVVAEEVRNLAARSANAAKETTGMIEDSVKKVGNGTKIASETAEALKTIVRDVEKVTNLVGNIATASSEQAVGVNQVNQGIMQVSQVVQGNSATSQEGAAASEELSSQADLLQEQVQRFTLRKGRNYSFKGSDEINPDVLRMLEQMTGRVKGGSNSGGEAEDHRRKESMRPNRIALSDREFGKY